MILHPSCRHRHRVAAVLFIAAGVLCTAVSTGSAGEEGAEPISWRGDYGGALEEAKGANRLLWIQFTGPWCPNCTRMERDSFPDPDVIQHARQSFVPLKLRSDVHEQLALGFNLSGLPATVIVAPTREIVAVRQGYLGPDELDSLLNEVHAAWRARDGVDKTNVAGTRPSATDRPDPSRPKSENQVALSGYCPVSLISDKRLVRGQTEYTIQHEGRVYRFASAVMSNLFRKDPERYIPVNRGDCPVSQVERGVERPGDPKWGVLYQGRLFLCASEDARRRFLKEPDRFAMVDVAEQGFCPHCLGETGLLVRGDPKYGLTRDGRRYWFPDPSHRDAFLTAGSSSSDTTRR
ncbi:MAG: thioredoxin family protein [Isosphaeraceae bacterium]